LEQRYSPTRAYRPRRAPQTVEDHDACALYAAVAKDAQPAHEPIESALSALETMLHRAGSVDGEGDGCGVLLDIPREIWAEEVRQGGHASRLTLDEGFAVAHIFIPRKADPEDVKTRAREIMSRGGLRILAERQDQVESSQLGPGAREEEPHFWQVGGLIDDPKLTFELTVALEDELDVHVASC
jgi:glutamate synthase (NADPH/NADH) large chain